MKSYIKERINQVVKLHDTILKDEGILISIEDVCHSLLATIRNGGSIYFCGNGGSAADAQHLATELSGRFYLDRPAISAEALGTNMAFTTAIANDFSYDKIYARSLEALGKKGDLLIALSTSGNSPNIIAAVSQAQQMDIKTVAITGDKGGNLSSMCEHSIIIPSADVPRIQEAYMVIGHIICEHLESELFNSQN